MLIHRSLGVDLSVYAGREDFLICRWCRSLLPYRPLAGVITYVECLHQAELISLSDTALTPIKERRLS